MELRLIEIERDEQAAQKVGEWKSHNTIVLHTKLPECPVFFTYAENLERKQCGATSTELRAITT